MTRQPLKSDYVSATQAGTILGVNRATVISWAKQGRIRGMQYGKGGLYRFLRADIEQFMADSRVLPLSERPDEID